MRLIDFAFAEGRFAGQSVDAGGLTVLFGANSSGKSYVLESMAALLGASVPWRDDPHESRMGHFVEFEPSLLVCLDGATMSTGVDASLMREQVRSSLSDYGASDAPMLTGTLAELRQALRDLLAEASDRGPRAAREALATELVQSNELVVDADGVHWVARAGGLTAVAREACTALAMTNDDHDDLVRIAREIEAGQIGWMVARSMTWPPDEAKRAGLGLAVFFLPATGEGAFTHRPLRQVHFGRNGGAASGLEEEVADCIEVLRQRFWSLRTTRDGLTVLHGWQPPLSEPTDSSEVQRHPWLERQDGVGSNVQLDGRIPRIADMIAARANELLRPFVRASGAISIRIRPIDEWFDGFVARGLRIAFIEAIGNSQQELALNTLGSGVRRFVNLAIRLAVHELETAELRWYDGEGIEVFDDESRWDAVQQAATKGSEPAVRLSGAAPYFLLVDEPEAHLHPGAVRSVADWLQEISRRLAWVVVATHAPAIVDVESCNPVEVTRTSIGVTLASATGIAERLGPALGCTRAELVLLTKLFVFVEGWTDKLVLEAMFGQQLADAGVRLVPIHGVGKGSALLDAELVAALDLPKAVLVDDDEQGAQFAERVTMLAIERDAQPPEVRVHGKRDILLWLDEGAVREVTGTDFPGWSEAVHRAGGRSISKHARASYSIDPETARTIALECVRRGKVPAELRSVITELIAFTSGITSSLLPAERIED